MKKLLILLLLFSSPVFADIGSGTFTPPTQRVDGTTLSPTEIAGYVVYLDGVTVEPPLLATATSYTITVTGTAELTIRTFDTEGRFSEPSIPITVGGKANPNPPQSVTVTITISVE